MHLRPAAGQGPAEAAPQPARRLVSQSRRRDRQRRRRGGVSPEAAAAGASRAARLGLHADLSVPCRRRRRCGSIRSAPDRSNSSSSSRTSRSRSTRNPDYWKKDRPYLDGVEYTIIPNRSTAVLGFVAGKFDMTFPTEISVPLMKDVKNQAPQAVCELVPTNVSTNLLINRDKPPFDNPEIRRAMMLALDRKAFIDILAEGKADIGGAMLPPPAGVWGLPDEDLAKLPGYGPDVEKNREEARAIMKKLGYGPDKPLNGQGRDPQHRAIPRPGGDPDRPAEARLYRRRARPGRDRELVPEGRAQGLPDRPQPDRQLGRRSGPAILRKLLYCGSQRNYSGYCNKEIDAAHRPAIGRDRPEQAAADRLGDRQQAAGGRGPADHHAQRAPRPAGSPMSRASR